MLVTIVFLLAACQRAPVKAGLATALLTAARPTGVLAIPYTLIRGGRGLLSAFAPGLSGAERRRLIIDAAVPVALAPLGIACFMIYLYWLTGDALAFRHVQRAWNRAFGDPVRNIYWALAKNDWDNLLHIHGLPSRSFEAACAILAGLAVIWLLRRGLWLETWLLGATLLLAATVGMASMDRFMTANPIFLLAVGDIIDRIPSRMLRLGLGAAGLVLQGALLAMWMTGAAHFH